MLAASDPNLIVASYGIAGLALVALWRLFAWLRSRPVRPDPWGAEIALQLENAQEVCPHCSTPQPPDAWFCAQCDNPVGPYHSFTPYVYQFSDGQICRADLSGQFRLSTLVIAGYLLLSIRFGVLAPLYCLAFIARLRSVERELDNEKPVQTNSG